MVFSFPSELSYGMLSSMYPCRKSEYRRQPINTRVFENVGEEISLVLSKMENSFYNTNTLSINFIVEYTIAAGGACHLLGSGYSHFSRQVWTALKNGQKIETIQNPGHLVNCMHNMTIESNTKDALALSFGYENRLGKTNYGRYINSSARYSTQSYSIPLIGIMNSNKLIPAFVSDLQLDLTLANITDIIAPIKNDTGDALLAAATAMKIKKIEIVCEVLTLEASSMAELLKNYQGSLSLKSESFLYTNSKLSTGESGVKDITYAHSLNSLTEFIWWSSPSNALDKAFGGVNPNLGANGWQLIVNSMPYPSQPVKCNSPAECFYQIQKAWGSLYSASHSGCLTRENFVVADTAFGEYVKYQTNALADTPKAAEIFSTSNDTYSNKFYNVLDLELINNLKDALYSGINTQDGTHTFRLNIDTVLSADHTIHIFSKFDVVLDFDYLNGNVRVIQ